MVSLPIWQLARRGLNEQRLGSTWHGTPNGLWAVCDPGESEGKSAKECGDRVRTPQTAQSHRAMTLDC